MRFGDVVFDTEHQMLRLGVEICKIYLSQLCILSDVFIHTVCVLMMF